ncbi:MAG: hypothetical protein PHC34_02385 [Candidatus Gastranaerophilales bacterium]|nr:hypothetical protein [Candidatus Gastranaerophilales bacterium]
MVFGVNQITKRVSLFNSLKDLDKKDGKTDGKYGNTSIFNEKNANLQKLYNRALANGESPELIDDFINAYIDSDANDIKSNKQVDGSVLNNAIPEDNANKNEAVKTSNEILSESEILSILNQYDDGTGKVFNDTELISKLDLSDDGFSNNSIYKYKTLINKPVKTTDNRSEDSTEYDYKQINTSETTYATPTTATNNTTETSTKATYESIKGGSTTGDQIANAAEKSANSLNSRGWCLRGVANALSALGNNELKGLRSAWMAKDVLLNDSNFKKVDLDINNLPKGAIVVWNKTDLNPHGHISVSLGNGQEASDHVQTQMTSLRGSKDYTIFVPKDMA